MVKCEHCQFNGNTIVCPHANNSHSPVSSVVEHTDTHMLISDAAVHILSYKSIYESELV